MKKKSIKPEVLEKWLEKNTQVIILWIGVVLGFALCLVIMPYFPKSIPYHTFCSPEYPPTS